MKNNAIAKEFHFLSLLRFAFPSIVLMVFMSLYTMVDGMFVSRFVGTAALSAVNITYPIYNILIAIGVMLATGGSAVIAKKMGEKKEEEARQNFTLIAVVGFGLSLTLMLVAFSFMRPLLTLLGANDAVMGYCYDYATTLLCFAPFAIFQMLFQYFFVTAGKPNLGLCVTILGGLTNIILDYLFIVPLGMGVRGAALATGIGLAVPGIFGLLYFTFHRKGNLYFQKPRFDAKVLWQSCSNGSSEMVTNLSMAIVTMMFNILMMRHLGEDGVAAITILLYSQFFLNAAFLGFSMGVAPVISYHYGAENRAQLRRLFRYSMFFVVVGSLVAFAAAFATAPSIASIFAKKGSNVYLIAMSGFGLFSLNFIFAGINIFASAMFTAYSNGKTSAILSFLRTFVFILAGLMFLPHFWGLNGIWLALPIAEFLAMLFSVYYIIAYKEAYHYA